MWTSEITKVIPVKTSTAGTAIRVCPNSLSRGVELHGEACPVSGTEERRGEWRLDRPSEEPVGHFGQDEQLNARQEYKNTCNEKDRSNGP